MPWTSWGKLPRSLPVRRFGGRITVVEAYLPHKTDANRQTRFRKNAMVCSLIVRQEPGKVGRSVMELSILNHVDLSQRLKRKEYEELLEARQQKFLALRLRLGGQIGGKIGPPLLILFEGWDAAGKGGCIRRLTAPLDPRHFSVHQYQAPTDREKRHHFLWRFWPAVPGRGGMCIFDRTWYGRVLVERVEGFASVPDWRRAYEEIRHWESLLVSDGTILIKFFLHISSKEQKRRFESRAVDPLRQWKLTDEDWRNRKKRDAYEEAIEEMVQKTDTVLAPWTIVAAESKRFARIKVLETVIQNVEAALG